MSNAVIGLTAVALGTSMPELATSLVAAMRGESAIGNAVGSNLFNLLGILGLSALVTPLVPPGLERTDVAVMAVLALALVPIMWSGRRVARAEGGFLAASYGGYLVFQHGEGNGGERAREQQRVAAAAPGDVRLDGRARRNARPRPGQSGCFRTARIVPIPAATSASRSRPRTSWPADWALATGRTSVWRYARAAHAAGRRLRVRRGRVRRPTRRVGRHGDAHGPDRGRGDAPHRGDRLKGARAGPPGAVAACCRHSDGAEQGLCGLG